MTMRRSWARVAVAAATAALMPVGAAVAAPAGIGAPGIGDPYYPDYGNGGYDVSHYDINVAYKPANDWLSGTTVIDARATQSLTRFDLDFMLSVRSVTVNGKKAAFWQKPHELVVRPAKALAKGERMKVKVTYAGIPSTYTDDGISPWIRTADGVAAVGEPEIAAWWYPSNDHPRDKATFDVKVTVAKDLEALGNGVLVSNTVANGQRTWHWREDKPMATYLAFFVVGQFDITKSTTKAGLPVINAVASDGGSEGAYAAADLARTAEVIDFEASQFGPYPFDALGGVAPAADFGFALENQTRPVYTRGFWSSGPNIGVIVHELAHQWYGDSVSLHNWRDVWLNEGFASYAEWLWSEHHDGGTGAELFQVYWRYYKGAAAFWNLPIGNPGAGLEFSGQVYDRGAMTLQALRTRVGDKVFFATMRAWAAQNKYGHGNIPKFIALAEAKSGQSLKSFFNAWLYARTAPAPTAENGFPAAVTTADAARSGATPKATVTRSFESIRATTAMLAKAERSRAAR